MHEAYTRKSADCRRKVSKVDRAGAALWWLALVPMCAVIGPIIASFTLEERAKDGRAAVAYVILGMLVNIAWWLFWLDFFGLVT